MVKRVGILNGSGSVNVSMAACVPRRTLSALMAIIDVCRDQGIAIKAQAEAVAFTTSSPLVKEFLCISLTHKA